MNVSNTLPPNWIEIEKTFPKAQEEQAVFCYGETLHNPFGSKITEDLKIHEAVHSKQQGKDPKGWWDKYTKDPKFRFDQEVQAYSAQVYYLKTTEVLKEDDMGNKVSVTPPSRVIEWYLQKIAQTLSGPLYGNVVTYHKALTAVRKSMQSWEGK